MTFIAAVPGFAFRSITTQRFPIFGEFTLMLLETQRSVSEIGNMEEGVMHVMAISTVTDSDRLWAGLKKAYGRLPEGAAWILALASTDGTRAVNVIRHDSINAVRDVLDEYAGPAAVTEYFEADAANAIGLGK
jgi:hypothetical protein